jgi:hypothetical protein
MSWAGELQQQGNGSAVSEQPAAEAVAEASPSAEHKVFLTLTDGERIEDGVFPTEGDAHVHAEELMAAAASATTTAKWPRIGGRYFRPETIVSIDVEPSDQPRWTGSTGRASSWNNRLCSGLARPEPGEAASGLYALAPARRRVA